MTGLYLKELQLRYYKNNWKSYKNYNVDKNDIVTIFLHPIIYLQIVG